MTGQHQAPAERVCDQRHRGGVVADIDAPDHHRDQDLVLDAGHAFGLGRLQHTFDPGVIGREQFALQFNLGRSGLDLLQALTIMQLLNLHALVLSADLAGRPGVVGRATAARDRVADRGGYAGRGCGQDALAVTLEGINAAHDGSSYGATGAGHSPNSIFSTRTAPPIRSMT
ncbi:hypothetical protein D3C86_1479770 [compost metagenome]